jgi:hypothetical protein
MQQQTTVSGSLPRMLSANVDTLRSVYRELTKSVGVGFAEPSWYCLFSLSIGKCWIIRRRGVSFKASACSHFWTSDTATVLKICETCEACPNVVRLRPSLHNLSTLKVKPDNLFNE